MNMVIKFRKHAGQIGAKKFVKVENIDEMKKTLTDFLNECKCEEVVYVWREDGTCLTGLGDEGWEKYEKDMEKFVDMVADRVNEFGFVEFEGKLGEFEGVGVYDSDNETYVKLKSEGLAR